MEVFERTARRESWPEDQWAHILSPFLTGPAQQAGQDLSAETAGQYPALIRLYWPTTGPTSRTGPNASTTGDLTSVVRYRH